MVPNMCKHLTKPRFLEGVLDAEALPCPLVLSAALWGHTWEGGAEDRRLWEIGVLKSLSWHIWA